MVNIENIEVDGLFHINTSTVTATYSNLSKALEAELIACIERDAFLKFWYLQNIINYLKLSTPFIISLYANNKTISKLYKNSSVNIVAFDLSAFSYCPTFALSIYLKKR